MAEERDIKYINREFGDFRRQLVEFAKNYFPDTYNDFSIASPGMMFIEIAAYVGDVLSFYQDVQLQETFLPYAKNPSNLYAHAYMMGYRPKITSVAEAEITITQPVDATAAPDYLPNWDQALRIGEGTTISARAVGSPTFILKEPVNFRFSSSYDPTDVIITELDGGYASKYLLIKKARAYSGEVKEYSKTYTTVERFSTIEIEDTNIIGVQEIRDSDNNLWTEVPFLGQDTVFQEITNTNSDSNLVPSLLQLTRVPRRYVTRFTSTGTLQIQFGAGVIGQDDSTFLPDPVLIATGSYINPSGSLNEIDRSFDPSNFLFSRTYGLAPSDTTLNIKYITGGGTSANVPANTITSVGALNYSGVDLTYLNDLTFTNEIAAEGGRDGDLVEEIRQNSLRSFSEQKRAVTLQDYTIRALSLPPRLGSIGKVYAINDYSWNTTSILDRNPFAISLYVLAYDIDSKLTTASKSLKENLKTYLSQYMMLTDALDIKDAFVINIGIKFDIITIPGYAARDVLLLCNTELKTYFDIRKWNINQPVNLAAIYTLLDKVKGVQTVKSIQVDNKVGGIYSEYGYDIRGATKDNIIYPSFDPCIFEIKYPDTDIEGRVTTL